MPVRSGVGPWKRLEAFCGRHMPSGVSTSMGASTTMVAGV
jgi:hypothetical protein